MAASAHKGVLDEQLSCSSLRSWLFLVDGQQSWRGAGQAAEEEDVSGVFSLSTHRCQLASWVTGSLYCSLAFTLTLFYVVQLLWFQKGTINVTLALKSGEVAVEFYLLIKAENLPWKFIEVAEERVAKILQFIIILFVHRITLSDCRSPKLHWGLIQLLKMQWQAPDFIFVLRCIKIMDFWKQNQNPYEWGQNGAGRLTSLNRCCSPWFLFLIDCCHFPLELKGSIFSFLVVRDM